jgi:uncharacterized protein YqjF (DUF2071 family)
MRKFLTAEWRYLVMLNYSVEADWLKPFAPSGVELDFWQGKTYVSMVGFLFLRTRVMGWRLPLHVDFEEVNLRFYVRRLTPNGWRRGVVFIKEIVPRRLIASVARVCYNENYVAMPMRHRIEMENGTLRHEGTVEYAWRHQGRWNALSATTAGAARLPAEKSAAEFITEHYWGYTARRNGGCAEYHVEHPRWAVWEAKDAALDCDTGCLYGPQFVEALGGRPDSAFVAEGSLVTVGAGMNL